MPVTLTAGFANLTELRKDLESVELGLGREVNEAIRAELSPLARAVSAHTPGGPGPQSEKDNLPHVADTITARPAGSGIVIESTHPAAGLINWGGTISPKGSPITFRGAAMGEKGGEQELPRIEAAISARIEALLNQHGL